MSGLIIQNDCSHKVVIGDCLDVMREMDDNSVDLVITSPPYEDARTYGIDFNLKGQDWVDWSVERFTECLRVSRGLVAWVVGGRTRQYKYSSTPILLMADLHRAGVNLRNPVMYQRHGVPGSGGPDWFKSRYEWVVCATPQGRLPWSDNTAMGHPPKWNPGGDMSNRIFNGRRVSRIHTKREPDGSLRVQGYNPPKIANPGNVIECGAGGGGHLGSPIAHENEAPFPERIPEWFIRSFCPPGGTVLDPFSGSGTTAKVAGCWGRKSISIDIRESQTELTSRRLEEVETKINKAEDSK